MFLFIKIELAYEQSIRKCLTLNYSINDKNIVLPRCTVGDKNVALPAKGLTFFFFTNSRMLTNFFEYKIIKRQCS